jgi:hypothetical protein
MTATTPPAAPPNDHDSHQRRYYRFANRVSLAAFVVACVAAIFTGWQAYLNYVGQRAFVFPILAQVYVSNDTANNPIGVNYVYFLTNGGNTATKDLKVFIKCTPAAEDLLEPWTILYQGQKADQQPAFIAPHASEQTGCSFTIDQIRDIFSGKLHGYVMIDISYYDRVSFFKVLRKTQYARRLIQVSLQIPSAVTPLTPVAFNALLQNRGKHNCADEECPD